MKGKYRNMFENNFIWSESSGIRTLVDSLNETGIRLWAEKDKIKFQSTGEKISDEVIEVLKSKKLELLKYFSKRKEVLEQSFDLTSIQEAYFLGRDNSYELGGISANYYFEVELEQVLPEELERAFNQTIKGNEALRSIITKEGKQAVLTEVPWYHIEIMVLDDEQKRGDLRHQLEKYMYPLESWPMYRVVLTTINSCSYRLQVGFDCILLDAWSVTLWLKQLFALYSGDYITFPVYTFRAYSQDLMRNRNLKLMDAADQYWESRAAGIPPAPGLPYQKKLTDIKKPLFNRISRELSKTETVLLYKKAKEYRVTPAAVICTAYMKVLANYSDSSSFSLNLTVFNRLSTNPDIQEVLGDFTNISVAAYEPTKDDRFIDEVLKTQQEFWNLVKYRGYEGVNIIRKINRDKPVGAALPVVFTGILQGLRESDYYLPDWAKERYAYSQTPQVSLDYQATDFKGNLSVNWDYVQEAFCDELIYEMFQKNIYFLKLLIQSDWGREVSINQINELERQDIPVL